MSEMKKYDKNDLELFINSVLFLCIYKGLFISNYYDSILVH